MNYSSPGNPSNQRAAGKLSKIFDVHSYAILNIGQQVGGTNDKDRCSSIGCARKETPPKRQPISIEMAGKTFAPDAGPMVRVKVGTVQHWRIVNATKGLHVMHIHQVNFLAHAENGNRVADRLWLDTVNVPYGGFVDAIMDFTDPVIKGMSVFHCHLLNHEDNSVMATILFQ
jgi:hypothetical protein